MEINMTIKVEVPADKDVTVEIKQKPNGIEDANIQRSIDEATAAVNEAAAKLKTAEKE